MSRLLKIALGTVLLIIISVALLSTLHSGFQISSWRVLLSVLTGVALPPATPGGIQNAVQTPPGLTLTAYAPDVPKARLLRVTAAGDVLVSQPRLGQITLLGRDADGNGLPDRQEVLLGGLDRPHGMDIHEGWLYIAEGGAVGRIRFDVASGKISGAYSTVLKDVPSGANHWTRTLRSGPDGWLYLSIGSTCNACIEEHPWRAALIRFKPDGTQAEVFASGLRNSVGFDWAPWDNSIYATDNGRDLLGDDFPPCELNRVVKGGFYGWPYVNGAGVADPDLGQANVALAKTSINPAHDFRAHNAPLGMTFLRHPANVAQWPRAAVVALHGSWNRSKPDGYKLVLLEWDAKGAIVERDFVSGFERDGKVIGRPVDVAEAGDGALLISDDYAGAVYRLVRTGTLAASAAATGAYASKPSAPNANSPKAGNPLQGLSKAAIQQASANATQLITRHNCVSCHIPGTPLREKWSDLPSRHDIDSLAAYFLAPTPPMPVLPLSPAERRDLAVHLLAGSPAGK
jgi:glucose/arabinose dehydrogenase